MSSSTLAPTSSCAATATTPTGSTGRSRGLSGRADAGADVLYPVGRHDPDTLRRLTSELPLPVNAIAVPDQDDPASFGPLGVARISFGPFWQAALALGHARSWLAGADMRRDQ